VVSFGGGPEVSAAEVSSAPLDRSPREDPPVFGTVDLWTYVVATVLIILLPGPNSLYVLSVASRKGRRAGFQAASGVFLGDSVLMVASAAGLASMFAASPVLYNLVRWAGVAYLAYLAFGLLRGGWKTWRAARRGEPLEAKVVEVGSANERPFVRALIASLLNPKAILFFVAFFVQFVDPGYAWPVLSYGVLFVILQCCSMVYLSTLIVAGDGLAQTFRRRRRLAAAGNGVVGAVMIAFAAKLATG
jgi:leucine efflux protein